MKRKPLSILIALALGLTIQPITALADNKISKNESASKPANTATPRLKIDYQKFTLANGLDVIFHIDKSDPVVAVNLTAHVGSAREKAGRTGFAHLFEHLLFLESENLGKGGLDKLSSRIGGSGANGSTSNDRTNYLQTVPKDALEKMIWAEADKLGWFINTVTDAVLAKEKQVVKNEKRQSVDNNPYGHTSYVIDKALYPADHPYNWQVIGSLEDLQNATVEDVKEFYQRWYVPNNTSLVIAGDFDPVQAKKWVEKYFGEIKRGAPIPPQSKRPGIVKETIKLYHEDNFARLPALTLVWPTVEQLHPDSYALEILGTYLSQGKKAPFTSVMVEDKKLSANVYAGNQSSELAGKFMLNIRAFDGKSLDEVANGITEAFAKFEKEGISEKDLNRIKAGQERAFYESLSSVLGKSAQLAEFNYLKGDPGYIEQDIKNTLAVTTADVMRVYEKYIKGKNYVATSFVPKGKINLALAGSLKADVVEEKIVQGAEDAVDPSINASYTKTPSKIDRSKEPPYGAALPSITPNVAEKQLKNGLKVYAIQNSEVPLTEFDIVVDGGLLLEDINKVGVSNLMANLMTKGTANKTALELEEAIQQLGASINVIAGTNDIRIVVSTLSKNYAATLALVEEIILHPRWDEKEFDLLKQSVLSQIRQQEANPNAIANNQFAKLLYGPTNLRGRNYLGEAESVKRITIEDLKAYYLKNFSPSNAKFHTVSSLPVDNIHTSLHRLETNWKANPVTIPTAKAAINYGAGKVYFYDVPNAKQSVIRVGYPALVGSDPDFYPATVANYILGGGGFASRLTQELREGKGYTYGINSAFTGNKHVGTFTIGSSVRSNVTLESTQLVKKILQDYANTFTPQDLETTKSFLSKSKARAFETAGAKLSMLETMSSFNWKPSYLSERDQIVNTMTVEKIQLLGRNYFVPEKMIWLIVGDAKTQLPRMKDLGFGEPILLNRHVEITSHH